MSEISPGVEAEVAPQPPVQQETPKPERKGIFKLLNFLRKTPSAPENSQSVAQTETLEDLKERKKQLLIYMADSTTSHSPDAKVIDDLNTKIASREAYENKSRAA